MNATDLQIVKNENFPESANFSLKTQRTLDVKSSQKANGSRSFKIYPAPTITDKSISLKSTQLQVALMVTNDFTELMSIQDLRYFIGNFLEIKDILRLVCMNKAFHDVWSDWLMAIMIRASQHDQLLEGGQRLSLFLKPFNRAVRNLTTYEQYNRNPKKIINNAVASTIKQSSELMMRTLSRIQQIQNHRTDIAVGKNHNGNVTINHDIFTEIYNSQSYQTLMTLEKDIKNTHGNIAKHTINSQILNQLLQDHAVYVVANIVDHDYHDESSMEIAANYLIITLRLITNWIASREKNWNRWDCVHVQNLLLPNIEKLLKKPNLPKTLRDKLTSAICDAYCKTKHADCRIQVLKDIAWLTLSTDDIVTMMASLKDITEPHHAANKVRRYSLINANKLLTIIDGITITEKTWCIISENIARQWNRLSTLKLDQIDTLTKATVSFLDKTNRSSPTRHSIIQNLIQVLPKLQNKNHFDRKLIDSVWGYLSNSEKKQFISQLKDDRILSYIIATPNHYKGSYYLAKNDMLSVFRNPNASKETLAFIVEATVNLINEPGGIVDQNSYNFVHKLIKRMADQPSTDTNKQKLIEALVDQFNKNTVRSNNNLQTNTFISSAILQFIKTTNEENIIQYIVKNINYTWWPFITTIFSRHQSKQTLSEAINWVFSNMRHLSPSHMESKALINMTLKTILSHRFSEEHVQSMIQTLNTNKPIYLKTLFDIESKKTQTFYRKAKALLELDQHIIQLGKDPAGDPMINQKLVSLRLLREACINKNGHSLSEKGVKHSLGQRRGSILSRLVESVLSYVFFFTTWFTPKSLRIADKLEANQLVTFAQ